MPALKNKVQLMDTTLRDGEQTQGVSFTPPAKANIAKSLLKKTFLNPLYFSDNGVGL